jgi:hypothetical protein
MYSVVIYSVVTQMSLCLAAATGQYGGNFGQD